MATMDRAAVAEQVKGLLQKHKVSGIQVAVLEPSGKIIDICAGLADKATGTLVRPGTVFEAASLSKTVGSVFAMEWAAKKGIALDTPVNTLLARSGSDFLLCSGEGKDPKWAEEVQLGQLMDHTGLGQHYVYGVNRRERMPDVASLLRGEREKDLGYPEMKVEKKPGTKFGYSGGGFMVLQHLLEAWERRPIEQICREYLDNLGMSEWSFDSGVDVHGQEYARGYSDKGKEVDGGRFMFPSIAAGGLCPARALATFWDAVIRSADGAGPIGATQAAALVDASAPDCGAMEFMGAKMARGAFVATAGRNRVAVHQAANEGFRGVYIVCASGPNKGSGFVILANGDNQAAILLAEVSRVLLLSLRWEGVSEAALKTTADFAFAGIPQAEIVNQVYKKLVFAAFLPDQGGRASKL